MPGFDFSKSEIDVWKTPMPNGCSGLYFKRITWEKGELEIIAETDIASEIQNERECCRYNIICTPLFLLTLHHEAMAVNLIGQSNKFGIPAGSHMKIRNSKWIASLVKHEKYGFDWHDGEAVHYVLWSEDEVLHIVSKQEPQFTKVKEWRETSSDIKFPPLSVLSNKRKKVSHV